MTTANLVILFILSRSLAESQQTMTILIPVLKWKIIKLGLYDIANGSRISSSPVSTMHSLFINPEYDIQST